MDRLARRRAQDLGDPDYDDAGDAPPAIPTYAAGHCTFHFTQQQKQERPRLTLSLRFLTTVRRPLDIRDLAIVTLTISFVRPRCLPV